MASFRRFGFAARFRRLDLISEVEKIVHGMAEILLAAEITFRGLNRGVPQQELNLLQLSSAVVTQLRTGPPEIMRRDVL